MSRRASRAKGDRRAGVSSDEAVSPNASESAVKSRYGTFLLASHHQG